MILYDEISIRDCSPQECVKVIVDKCSGIKKSLRLIEKDNGHLKLRCPLSGEYLLVEGDSEEIFELDRLLTNFNLYRVT